MKYRKILMSVLVLMSMIGLLFFTGCPDPQRRPAPAPTPPNYNPGPGPAQSEQIPDFRGMDPGPIEGGNPNPNLNGNGAQEARRLATMINVLPEVNSSSVILTGNTAVVGLNLKSDLSDQRIDAIKAEVSRRIKRANNRITNVTVTADPDIVARIQRVTDGMRQGRTLASFRAEMSEIMQRLTPATR